MTEKLSDFPGRLGIVIQARMGSSRLPGKVLRPFYQDRTILDIIVEKFRAFPYPIVLATSGNKKDDVLERFAKERNVGCYRGDEHNVLSRFTAVGTIYGFDHIVRVCADNPFISVEVFAEMLQTARSLKGEFDYLSPRFREKPAVLTHFGVFVELVRTAALNRIEDATRDTFYFEHVTNYIYTHPDHFMIRWLDLPDDFFASPDIRMTIDTEADFLLSSTIYREMMKDFDDMRIENINTYLRENPQILEDMREQIRLNTK